MANQELKTVRGVPDLTYCSPDELMELFKTLPAPTLEEMEGEFHSTKLTYDRIIDYIEWRVTCDNPFFFNCEWVGKAFHKIDDEYGRGYNIFRKLGGKVYHRYPMMTTVAPSRVDGKPAYYLIYHPFPRTLTSNLNMVDEIRKVGDGTYLLCGYYGFTKKQKAREHFWLLEGPYRAYRGDIGRETPKKVDLSKENPNYKKIMKQAKKEKKRTGDKCHTKNCFHPVRSAA